MERSQQGNITAVIADTGVGIPKDSLAKILEPYYGSGNETGASESGLGLTMVKRVLNLLGGEIMIKSDKNDGTTVTIKIPYFGTGPLDSP